MESGDEDYDEADELDESYQHTDTSDYIFSLFITDYLQQIFILLILVGNFVSINIAIIFMCLAWYIRSSVEKHITFLQEFYNLQAVPAMVGLSGFLMLAASVLGVKSGMGGRMTTDEKDMKSVVDFLFIYAVSAAVVFGAMFITALTCFIEIGTLRSALGEGLLAGMKKYKEDSEVKPEIDILQINFECCGSKNYKDWYNVSWVASKYLETGDGFIRQSMKKEDYFGKDVPFSCCDWRVMRPCVDTRMEDRSYNSKYEFPVDLTVYNKGCRDAVSGFLGHTIFKGVGLFIFFYSFLWAALGVIGRYLNTSMASVFIGKPPVGWLIPYVRGGKTAAGKSKERDVEESEESESE